MSIYLELPPEIEARLTADAANKGTDPAQVVRALVEKAYPPRLTVAYLLTLPRAEQERLMDAAMEDAAPLYAADLALPPHERELTAFEALNDYDPIYESPEDYLFSDNGETTAQEHVVFAETQNSEEPIPMSDKSTMRYDPASNGRSKAIEFARQGGTVLCNTCLTELTFEYTNSDQLQEQLLLSIRCPKDRTHTFTRFIHKHPDDPLEKFMRELSNKRKNDSKS